MLKKENSCSFTGHRPSKLPWGNDEDDPRCRQLKKQILDAVFSVYDSGIRHFICGMAIGSDMYFCEAVFELRNEHPEVTVEAAMPCEGQSSSWQEKDKLRYERLVSECDYQTVMQKDYTADCMLRRNRYMIDSSSVLIAAFNGRNGGTMSTVLYALRSGLEIIELPVE